jgi:membrane-associated phospholipid phosphatase
MEAIWQCGINLILIIQQIHGPLLDNIFRVITFMGEEQFYLAFLPLIVWCFDYSFGAVLAIFFMLSDSLNVILKYVFQHPRPFDLNPSLKLAQADGYGLPSGHSQLSVTAWGAIAIRIKKLWFWIVAIVIMLLIAFSRIYLGVHFPTDVFAGWLLGAILLAVYVAVNAPLRKWLAGLNLWLQILIAAGVPLLLLLLDHSNESLTSSGILFGMGVGLAFARRYISFSVSGAWWLRTLRFITGFIIILALYAGLKSIFPPDGTALGPVFRFIRYGLVGAWVTLGAPWLFRIMRLAQAAE